MDFSLTEEQRDIQQLTQQILSDSCTAERLTQLEARHTYFDKSTWQALADAGLLGLAVEESSGGMGFGFESLCLLLEECGRHVAKLPVLSTLVGVALPLQSFAPPEARQRWLPDIVSGKAVLSWARVEVDNEDPLNPQLLALTTEYGYQLTGNKALVPFAADADAIVLGARTEAGVPIVVVVDSGADKLARSEQQVTSGETCYLLELDGVRLPRSQVLAEGPTAEQWLLSAEQHYQAAICAMAVGLCDRMTRMTASYTSEREQFGRAVASFQAVAHRMADCYRDVECLRLTTQQAIHLLSVGEEAADAVEVAKVWCGDVCHRVSQAAQHCHGGIGVDRDYPLFRYCLMARELELTAGSSAALLESLGNRIAEQAKAAVLQ